MMGSDRWGFAAFPPLQTEQARFRALRFPVGPVDSGRADSPLPTERCTSLEGPSSAFLSTSVDFHLDRLTLAVLHLVLAITARHWATTPPPPSVLYARMVASHQGGSTVLEFPSSNAGADSVLEVPARRRVVSGTTCAGGRPTH